MALDSEDYSLFGEIKNALVQIADELHKLNESHKNNKNDVSIT